jgi:cytochrome P450
MDRKRTIAWLIQMEGLLLETRYDPYDPATIQNPLPALRRLQDDAPVYWCDALRGWIVTRYDDVKTLQLDKRVSADRLTPFYESRNAAAKAQMSDLIRYLNTWAAFKDPPDHNRMRQMMNQVMPPRVVKDLHAGIAELVTELLDSIDSRRLTRFDFIDEFANPLPASVIMDLLGVPRSDMRALRDWSGMIQPFIGGATVSDNKYDSGREGILAMADYFRSAIAMRGTEPREDVISQLVDFKQSGMLTEDELVGMCMLFLFAGHETTTNLIGNGIRALIANPDQMLKLAADPELATSMVEECLRFDGPTGAVVRVVRENMEMQGQHLRQGERIFLMMNAANHDPRRFETPERFLIDRHPNPHVAFNHGPHFCLGAPLARAEARMAILAVLDRYSNIRLLEEPAYMDTLVMRGVRTMPIEVERRSW